MSEITDGLGTAVEGGLLAKAVEPAEGGLAEGGEPNGKTCDNCGTALIGAHCHACGQRGEVHRSLSAIGHEILHGVLHLDGKIWRTLPWLMFKPGKLTRRYIDGERAKFVSPMAMFLFSVFLMFAVFQVLGISAPTDIQASPEAAAEVQKAGENVRNETAEKRAELEARLAELPADAPERAAVQADLDELALAEDLISGAETIALGGSTDGVNRQISIEESNIDWINNNVVKKWRENPGLMLYKLQANGYKFSWFLIPLSIPFVWLLFAWKRRFKAYDHAVFVTYSLAFMTGLFILLSLIYVAGLDGDWVFLGVILIPPIHLYKHLRHTYELSRLSALWRLGVLIFIILFVSVLFLQSLVLLGGL